MWIQDVCILTHSCSFLNTEKKKKLLNLEFLILFSSNEEITLL